MRTSLALALASSLAVAPGCGAIFTESHVAVTFQSDPQGADVIVDGVPVGRTPVQAMVSNRYDHIVEFQMPGAAPTTCMLTSSVGAGYIVLDVLFTGLIGVIVDAVTDGWNELDQGGCYARMGAAQRPDASPEPVAMSLDR